MKNEILYNDMVARLAGGREKILQLRRMIAFANIEIVKTATTATPAQRQQHAANIKDLTAQYFDQLENLKRLQKAVECFEQYNSKILNKTVPTVPHEPPRPS